MEKILDSLSNRELATIIWLLIFLSIALMQKSIRKSIGSVLTAFFDKKILTIILTALIYSSAVIFILYKLKLWQLSFLKDSFYWYSMTALVILFNLNDTSKNKNYFKDILLQNIRFMVIIEFIVNIFSFSLWIELIFIPIFILISIISAYGESYPEYKKVGEIGSAILSVIGLTLFILSITEIIKSFENYANAEELKIFLFPIILSITFIPFAYMTAIYMEYEILFARMKIFHLDKNLLRFTKRRLFLRKGIRLWKIKSMTPIIIKEFYSGISKDEIKTVIR
ncbi:MAG: hypothetical protein JXB49_08820 [Bacteroidales bacterium]|nr:hypothetical protein [Bacteroidales bacterium]